jgi:hypothetical protein
MASFRFSIVILANAGIQFLAEPLGPRLRGNDDLVCQFLIFSPYPCG